MFGIKIKITKFTDDWQPGWVECEFTDVFGKLHVFNEKVPIVTEEYLDQESIYPQNGFIACEIVERRIVDNLEIVKVNTELPWHIESNAGETMFEILPEQLVEFQHTPVSIEQNFIPFGENMVAIDYHLQNLYDAFNSRDIETVLSLMADDVQWANGMEGGYVFGRDDVREYWCRQFAIFNPQLEILESNTEENKSSVKLRQIVRDLDGNVLDDKTVEHVFTFDENGLIKNFEIGNFTKPFAENQNFQKLKSNS